jgi:UDP-glucose 4-epimerase
MKLASEALISAAAESHLKRTCLFRFPNVVGVPATHGVILDFVRKLKSTDSSLKVLGNGTQRKAYLHVSDLISAMLFVRSRVDTPKTLPINVGPVDQGVYVHWIAEQVVKRVAPAASIQFGTGNRGWVGDVPKFHYSTAKIQALGWKPLLGSEAALIRAIDEIARQEGF